MFKAIKITQLAFALITLLTSTNVLSAQQLSVFTTPDSVAIGDVVTYTIIIPSGTVYDSFQAPDSASFGAKFEFLGKKQFKTSTSADSIEYQLQYFGTENAEIKGLFVTFISADIARPVAIPDVVIPFKTMLLAEEQAELKPLKDIYAFKVNWIPYILLLVILILSAWVVARYITKYRNAHRNKEIVEVQLFKNPLDHLEVSLLALRSHETLIQRDFKSFYTLLGDLLREYIETVHNLGALEMTSRELVREMERAMVDPDLTRQINVVLRRADMVKFAKLEPSVEEALESIRDAERFVQIARQTDIQRVVKMQKQFDLEQEERLLAQQKPQQGVDEHTPDHSNDSNRKDA